MSNTFVLPQKFLIKVSDISSMSVATSFHRIYPIGTVAIFPVYGAVSNRILIRKSRETNKIFLKYLKPHQTDYWTPIDPLSIEDISICTFIFYRFS